MTAELQRDESRRCARCRCYLSAAAAPHERYCIVCHPARERGSRLCAAGHPLEVYAVRNGGGKYKCARCESQRAYFAERRAS